MPLAAMQHATNMTTLAHQHAYTVQHRDMEWIRAISPTRVDSLSRVSHSGPFRCRRSWRLLARARCPPGLPKVPPLDPHPAPRWTPPCPPAAAGAA